jgi:kanamycin kinase
VSRRRSDCRKEYSTPIAGLTRRLHALPVEGCPFDRTLARSVPAAQAAVADGHVDLDDLDDEHRGWTNDQLLANLAATTPTTEDLVVCHGDLSLPNLIVDARTSTVTGVIDLGRLGIADRYADLALITRDLDPSQAHRFLAAYGAASPDVSRLAFYRLLDEFF